MGAITTRTIKTEDGVAVLLPESLGFTPDTDVIIEQTPGGVRIKRAPLPQVSPEEALARNQRMVAEIRAIWNAAGGPPSGPVPIERLEFPDRPGLY